MAVKLKLTRLGSKKHPFYRVVAANDETRRHDRSLRSEAGCRKGEGLAGSWCRTHRHRPRPDQEDGLGILAGYRCTGLPRYRPMFFRRAAVRRQGLLGDTCLPGMPHRRRMALFPRGSLPGMQRPLTPTVLSRQGLREASNESFD